MDGSDERQEADVVFDDTTDGPAPRQTATGRMRLKSRRAAGSRPGRFRLRTAEPVASASDVPASSKPVSPKKAPVDEPAKERVAAEVRPSKPARPATAPAAAERSEPESRSQKPAAADDATEFTRIAPARPKRPAKPQADTARPEPPRQAASVDVADDRTRIAPARPKPRPQPDSDHTRIAPPRSAKPAPRKPDAPRPRATASTPPPAQVPVGDGMFPLDANGRPLNVLKQRFLLEDVLGMGGMGIVYKAKDHLKVEANDRDPYVAVKVLSEEFKSHPEAFVALQRESRKSQRMAHPNIVNVHDFDRDGDLVFMTMEFLDGQPLDRMIKQYAATGLPEEMAVKVVEGMCAALAHAHSMNIVHSDFKPGNVFVTRNGTAKVFDFGIARAVSQADLATPGSSGSGDQTLFDPGVLGALTPAYASLEMLQGEEPDPRDDIYALGCVIYELYAGVHPFNKLPADKAKAQGLKPQRLPELSRRQWHALEKTLAFEREQRVATVDAFLDQWKAKRKTTYALVLTASVLLAVGAVTYARFGVDTGPQVDTEKLAQEAAANATVTNQRTQLTELLDSARIDPGWESLMAHELTQARAILGPLDDPLLPQAEAQVAGLYLQEAQRLRGDGEFEAARQLVERFDVFGIQAAEITALAGVLEEDIQQQKQQQLAAANRRQQAAAAERRAQQLATARAQMGEELRCLSSSAARKHDLDINVVSNAIATFSRIGENEFRKLRGGYETGVRDCIQLIAKDSPERAEEVKAAARRWFPGSVLISGIRIVPRDPCHSRLAGKGDQSRAWCRDALARGDAGPWMVVIPAGQGHDMFAIGKYEVSVGEYNLFCRDSRACQPVSGDAGLPVTGVTVDQARRYAGWLSKQTGREYRLPSQQEWVYAARAQGGQPDPNRNCQIDLAGVHRGDMLIKARVGKENGWGLVNHVGNVQEWAQSRGGRTVALGGSREDALSDCVVNAMRLHSGKADAVTGFRLAREVSGR